MKRKILTIIAALAISTIPSEVVIADEICDTWLSEEYQQYCIDIGTEYGICPELLVAIIETESSGKAKATNGNCRGLMQVNLPYHKERMQRLGVTDLYDARQNILCGTDYLFELFQECEDVSWVLMTYNGSAKATSLYENGKMTKYSELILQRSFDLERLHEEQNKIETESQIECYEQ